MQFQIPCLSRSATQPSLAHLTVTTLAIASLGVNATAQRAGITSPGSPSGGGIGQSTRFDNEFNPAISLTADLIIDYVETDDSSEDDGANARLSRSDLLIADWIDPSAFAWATIAYEREPDGESEFGVEEIAIEYVALPDNFTMRGGRFFVDFGKQMQSHIEELRTINRPLVLREFLGEELAADGLQLDHWSGVGESTLLRWSLGAFTDLSGGGHGHEEEEGDIEVHVPPRKSAGNFGFTGRLTGLTEIGSNGNLQVGLSGRFLNDFAFEDEANDLEVAGQSNVVYGLDLTYGWVDDLGVKNFTAGGELLIFDGDLSAEINGNGTPGDATDDFIDVYDDAVSGYYAYVDYGWTSQDSTGVQYSLVDEPEGDAGNVSEVDIYYTRYLSEFLRLRVEATLVDSYTGEDSTQFAIQLVGFIGPHGHGLNW
jgi:hypothetical protein